MKIHFISFVVVDQDIGWWKSVLHDVSGSYQSLEGIKKGMHPFLAAGLYIADLNSTPQLPIPIVRFSFASYGAMEFATIGGAKFTTIQRANDTTMVDSRKGEGASVFSVDACYCY